MFGLFKSQQPAPISERTWAHAVKHLMKGRFAAAIRSAFSGGRPGAWATDHMTEARHFIGWNYVAVHSAAIQAAGAEVMALAPKAQGKLRKRHVRRMLKQWSLERDRLRKSHDLDIPEGLEELSDDHPVARLLDRPNPTTSGAAFRYEVMQQLRLTGTALIYKLRGVESRKPLELYCMPTAVMQPRKPTKTYPHGGWNVGQVVANLDAEGFSEMGGYADLSGKILDARDVLVIRWPHPIVRDDGFGPLAAGATWSDAAGQLDMTRFSQLKHALTPGLTITPKGDAAPDYDEIQRAIAALNALSGPEHAGKNRFIPGDVEVTIPPPKDMEYTNGFEQMRDALLAIHQTPGVAAGITDGGSYAAFYAALKQYIVLNIQPSLNLIAEELTEQLAAEFDPSIVVWLHAAAVDDPTLLEHQIANDDKAGIMRLNERRALRGLPPDEGENGEKFMFELSAPKAPGAGPGQPGTGTEQATEFPGVPQMPKSLNGKHNGKHKLNGKSHRLVEVMREVETAEDVWKDYP